MSTSSSNQSSLSVDDKRRLVEISDSFQLALKNDGVRTIFAIRQTCHRCGRTTLSRIYLGCGMSLRLTGQYAEANAFMEKHNELTRTIDTKMLT
jgi:hypothetical protein